MTIFYDLLQKFKSIKSLDLKAIQAIEWFYEKTPPKKLTKTYHQKQVLLNPGNVYMFHYTAKHYKTLPYYDKFPLTVIIDVSSKYFMGLNVHYLPPELRAQLFDQLYDVINNDNCDESTKFLLTYRILKSTSRFKLYKPTLKKYLFNQVRSQFIYIPPSEWNIALFLPTERFVGGGKNNYRFVSLKDIWEDSRRKI